VLGREREDPPEAYFRHGRTSPGWAWWELPLAQDDGFDPGPGPAIVAPVGPFEDLEVIRVEAGMSTARFCQLFRAVTG
jgi:hypothetical protein